MSPNDSTPEGSGTGDGDRTNTRTAEANDREIACTLTEAEARERRETVKSELFPHLSDLAVGDGTVTMTVDDGALDVVTTYVRLEHECCSFAAFDLTVTPYDDPIELTMRGEGLDALFEEGLKPMVEEYDPSLLA
ncbi:MAG: hypothetical protein ABEH66_08160 [Halobacteriales archaeon]